MTSSMKIGLAFVNAGPFAFPDNLAVLARTAEEVGIESLWTVEHVVIPVGYRSPYPYSPSGKIPGPENVPIPDPLVALGFLAGITERVRLATGILILPQRHPAYVAKEVATLDVLSKGRAILGVGSGWLAEEFETVGVPFRERGARTDEAIRAIRELWKSEPTSFAGEFYRWSAVESQPKPVQRGGVPIVVGGHSVAAAKRAARHGDGFFPAKGDEAMLAKLFATMREECARVGRRYEDIELTGAPPKIHDLDAVRRYRDLGITRVVTGPPAFDAEGLRRGLHDLAERVISKL